MLDKHDIATAEQMAKVLRDSSNDELVVVGNLLHAFLKERETVLEAQPADPMNTPLPCDVKVGHVVIRKGIALQVLVARMQVLYDMAQPAPVQECQRIECMGSHGCRDWCWKKKQSTTPLAAQPAAHVLEPVAGKRCILVESCKSCKHSLGRLSCTLANRDFDSITRTAVPPEWCPLPVYTTGAQKGGAA
jgi:hypothetical protein